MNATNTSAFTVPIIEQIYNGANFQEMIIMIFVILILTFIGFLPPAIANPILHFRNFRQNQNQRINNPEMQTFQVN